jgi:transposase-like protein
METHRRGSDGRRLFNAEFKREQVARVLRKELTFAELSRELGISLSVVRRWQLLVDRGSRAAVTANEDVVPAHRLLLTSRERCPILFLTPREERR